LYSKKNYLNKLLYMNLTFHKYQGAGNDFIIIDNRTNYLKVDEKLFASLCDRRFGIGADGIILLQKSDSYDFEMIYANSDGKPSTMCGNGGRCVVAFAHSLGIFDTETTFMAIDGLHYAKMIAHNQVSLKMIDVNTIEQCEDGYFLNTGSPHLVVYTDDIDKLDVYTEGKKIRYNDRFREEGTNVNFVEDKGDQLLIRTYERGVEGETLACGTGATAVALVDMMSKGLTGKHTIKLKALGGDLAITASTSDGISFTDIYLEGGAKKVFEGVIEI
jgi:diaminopimelate epimerase